MHVLHAPTAADEFGGEVVEEFGVGGLEAHAAEVAWRLHEAGAEVALPDAVDHDAGGEWVLCVGDPVGEGAAAVLLGGSVGECHVA